MKTYLAADTTNGVYKISRTDVDGELLSGEAFLNSLKGCADTETIFGLIEKASMLKKIDAEYGIH